MTAFAIYDDNNWQVKDGKYEPFSTEVSDGLAEIFVSITE